MNKKLKTYRRTYREQLSLAPYFPNPLPSLLFPLPVATALSRHNVLILALLNLSIYEFYIDFTL